MSNFIDFATQFENDKNEGVLDITPEELLEKKDQVELIDVRKEDEYHGELGHIPGAKHLMLDMLPSRFTEVNTDKTVVFICRSGGRSGRATHFAKENGHSSAYNLKGGMILWNEKNFPIEK